MKNSTLMKFALAALLAAGIASLSRPTFATYTSVSRAAPGTVIIYAGTTCPTGSVAADGSSVLRTGTYTALFAAIGTAHGTVDGTHFNLPDYRGRFLRGVDGSAGRDPDDSSRTAMNTGGNTGDAIGSVQGEQFKSHTHTITDPGHSHSISGSSYLTAAGTSQAGTDGRQIGQTGGISVNSNTTGITQANASSGGNETRPLNAYVNYCIFY